MLCQHCKAQPASLFYRVSLNGRQQQWQLCRACAESQGIGQNAAAPRGFGSGRRSQRPTIQLTDETVSVLKAGSAWAAERGCSEVSPEFVLLGLLTSGSDVGHKLSEAGLAERAIREGIAKAYESRPAISPEETDLSPRMKQALQLSGQIAFQQGQAFISPEHLLAGILNEGESLAAQLLQREVGGSIASPTSAHAAASPQGGDSENPFLHDLTARALAGKLDPVIGRSKEIERVTRILSRKTKNNPVLIGEPGVGKTAIAEGLALKIVAGEIPETLKDCKVLSLDLGGMVAGTKYRGEFEERLKGLLDALKKEEGKAILFIDELHTVIGAGSVEGGMDAANLLKPALARGELRCIGATTLAEYRKHIEKDAALERRFQPVLVGEPSILEAIEILRGLRDAYEAHHRVSIADEALVAAVELSERYVTDRFLPDKAIDLIDEAAAMLRLQATSGPDRVKELETALNEANREKEASVAAERFDDAARHKVEVDSLSSTLEEARKEWKTAAGTAVPRVSAEDIAQIVSEWTGIPASKLTKNEVERLLGMEDQLKRRIIGQAEPLVAISEAVRRARAGLKDPNRPIGSFLFLGPTGVGKTETARALAEFLFNDEAAMIRFDMSEYQEKHTVSRLVGAPPGYVGYDEAGQLTEAVRRRPYSVILFDEIEKAHHDVFNLLLQILDDGRLTDSQGRTVDFKNAVVIMTSNVGAKHLVSENLGFRPPTGDPETSTWEEQRQQVMEALKSTFRPEFLNRIDDTIVFSPLERGDMLAIVDLLLTKTANKLRAQGYALKLENAAREAIAEQGFEPAYGARPLRRVIQRQIESPLGTALLEGRFKPGMTILVSHTETGFGFSAEETAAAAA